MRGSRMILYGGNKWLVFHAFGRGKTHLDIMNEYRYAEQLFARMQEWTNSAESVTAQHHLPAQAAQFSPLQDELGALLPPDISQLYIHQQQAVDYALRHEHITVATSTAS